MLMLSPIVPHITQALWQKLGHSGLILKRTKLASAIDIGTSWYLFISSVSVIF
ncbi:hypothetical protein THIOM_002719 [Candidatus Thiomargarita nelsonii]|uniref:Methionyl/Valyl/Leucyl/Isoleucyl-tRNA synthetase anticodon-binding domain-containing protein n=1 Tax=Candidatus Thiomargarita nelsonii TaxID=1003181 RepID=A0A176S0P3_9GAMM|nr:hypothetical protein THIOM_002719 [Candidatus Thiomargarita nelsonii]